MFIGNFKQRHGDHDILWILVPVRVDTTGTNCFRDSGTFKWGHD